MMPRWTWSFSARNDDPGLAERRGRLAPTVQSVDHLRRVNQAEYEFVITDRFESPWRVPNTPIGRGVLVAGTSRSSTAPTVLTGASRRCTSGSV